MPERMPEENGIEGQVYSNLRGQGQPEMPPQVQGRSEAVSLGGRPFFVPAGTELPRPPTEREARPLTAFDRAYNNLTRLRNVDRAILSPEEQANHDIEYGNADRLVDQYFETAKENNFLDGLEETLEDIHTATYVPMQSNPEHVIDYLEKIIVGDKVMMAGQAGERVVEDEGRVWGSRVRRQPNLAIVRAEYEGVRIAFVREGINRMIEKAGEIGSFPSPERAVKSWEWQLDKERLLWEYHEFYGNLRFKRELIATIEDLETAFRQFIRDRLVPGVTVDSVLGEMEPLGKLVLSEAHRLGASGKEANRKSAEAIGRLLLYGADWFAKIGKRDAVEQLLGRFTDDSTEKVLGIVLSYNALPLEATSLLTFKGPEGRLNLTPDSPLFKEFKDLGLYHPENLRFVDYYQPDGPHGEFYGDKVKQEKYQDLIKRALVNRVAMSSIRTKGENGKENLNVKKENLLKASLGLKGLDYQDINDAEFLDLFGQPPKNADKLRGVIEAGTAAYELKNREENEERLKHLNTPDLLSASRARRKEVEGAIDEYEKSVDQAKDAVNIGMQLLTVFGFSSELLCPRIWKRESITYVPNPDGKYVLDEEEGIYVPAMRRFKLDKNGKIQIDPNTGLPKPEFEYNPNVSRFTRVQGDYVRDADGHKILVSIEDEIRERLGYDANNNISFFPLDDRGRTVSLTPEYPKPGWMKESLSQIDPKDYIRYMAVLPEQRDLMIRKTGKSWEQGYIVAHRQLFIDYAKDASEYEGSDLRGTIPENFAVRYAADHPGTDISTPEAVAALEEDYLAYIKGGFQKEINRGIYRIPGLFAYQPDIIYGGGSPFAIKKDEYLLWWILGDPIQNMQKADLRSINFVSLLDTGVRSVGRQYMGGPYFRRFVQGLALKAANDAIVLDDYETEIWKNLYGGADDLRQIGVGRKTERGYQTGFLHSFLDKKENLKSSTVIMFYRSVTENETNKRFSTKEQYELLHELTEVFGRQFSFAGAYLAHNGRTSVPEEGKWFATRFMNGVFDLAGSEFGHYAYPDLANTLYIILNKVKLSEFGNKTVRDVLVDLYVKNYE